MSKEALADLYYIKLPENFNAHGFAIDNNIMIPVEKQSEDSSMEGTQDIKEGQILSGLLKVLAYDKDNPHTSYYRNLLMQARPNIKTQLADIAIFKTHNEDWDIAQEMFEALHGVDPDDMAIILNTALFYDQKADALRKMGNDTQADIADKKALDLYEECLQHDDSQEGAYFNVGFFYLKKKQFRQAKDAFESYLALTVKTPDSVLGENGIYKRERARQIVDNIRDSDLDCEEYCIAYSLINSDKVKEGMEHLERFLQKRPDVWNGWFLLGWALRKQGRYEDAKKAFEEVIKRECANSDCYNELAICQLEMGQVQNAIASLNMALAQDPEDTKVISNLGFCYLRLGNKEEAKKYFAATLELCPTDEIAKLELEKIQEI